MESFQDKNYNFKMESEFQVHAIALKTLKQRCEYLQEKLNAVEEENCKLKLAQDLNKKTYNKSASSDLEEQIMILNKEKSQMARQIKIISSENLALWSQLSELLPGKDVSFQNLAFSNAMSSQGSKFKSDKSNDLFGDCSKESLEEISLKLINGILMGKNELEKQCSQMIDLQNESTLDVKNVSLTRKQFDKRSVMKNLKDHVQKLKDIKQALYQQKSELSDGIAILKNLEILPKPSSNVGSGDDVHFRNENDVNIIQFRNTFSNLQDVRTVLNGEEVSEDSKMVCPMCGNNFTGVFKDFYQHVCEHFSEENEVFVDASANLDVF